MDLSDLNYSQKQAVTFNGKHCLVLAGAGTGKTRTIISRASYLISEGVDPTKIQILTFTKRAASEIVNRVKSNLDSKKVKGLKGSTFHSWCNYLMLRFPNLFGTASFTIIDRDDQVSIMKLVCGKNKLEYENLRIKPRTLVDLYSFARNTKKNLSDTIRFKLFDNVSNDEIDNELKSIKRDIEPILRGYEQKKRERNYLDFDDMLAVVSSRISKDQNAKNIIGKLYDHILVDEMQDTNPLQWDLLKPFEEIARLYCVGDDAQSIYGFRGADFKNIHLFRDRIEDSTILRLEENYRSTQEILDLSNWLLENALYNYDKKLKSTRGSGITPMVYNVDNEWEEASFISDTILENYSNNNKRFKDHLVLSRSQYYTRMLEGDFIKKKIPYVKYGGMKFMESAHIKDIMALLRVINNIHDEIAWIRFLTLWEGIGNIRASKYVNKILKVKNLEECIEVLGSIDFMPGNSNSTKIIYEIAISLAPLRGNVGTLVRNACKMMDDRLSYIYKNDWQKRKGDLPVFQLLAEKYSSLEQFITEFLLDGSIDNYPKLQTGILTQEDKTEDYVIISTIHSAKGLEADVCFLMNVSPGTFPHVRSIGREDEIEEERRVLYVAMTRAKNQLILTRSLSSISAMNRSFQVNNENNQINSYFLNEIPENLVEYKVLGDETNFPRDINDVNEMDWDIGMDFS